MSEITWITTLIITGIVLQVAGMWLVLAEVAAIRTRVRAYRQRPLIIRPFTVRARSAVSAAAVVSPRSSEQRLEHVERGLVKLGKRVERKMRELTQNLETAWQQDVQQAAKGVADDVNELAGLVLGLNDDAGLRRTTLGVVLIGLSIAVGTAAGIWSLHVNS